MQSTIVFNSIDDAQRYYFPKAHANGEFKNKKRKKVLVFLSHFY